MECVYTYAITPNDAGIMADTDSRSVQNAVEYAHASGVNRVLIPRRNERTGENLWQFDAAVILPSEMEVILDNCYIRQMDGTMDNVFRNFPQIPPKEVPAQSHDVRIIGRGNAVIDGGAPNALSEDTSCRAGRPHVSANNTILLWHIRHFTLENFTIVNQRWWGINLIHAEMGRLSNLHIQGECDRPTQDGVDLRVGCHDIVIENLTGQAGDDFIALSAIGSDSPTAISRMYAVPGRDEDIHDIIIRNIIATSVACSVIALRNSDDRKLYNITIDTVHDTDNAAADQGKLYPAYPAYDNCRMDIARLRGGNTPYALLRIGQYGYYTKRNSRLGECWGIHVSGLHARMGCVVMINVALADSSFRGLYAGADVDYIVTTKSGRKTQRWGADIQNVVFSDIFCRSDGHTYGAAFDFDTNDDTPATHAGVNPQKCETPPRVKAVNVLIQRAFLGECPTPFHMNMEGMVQYSDVFGAHVLASTGILHRKTEEM